MRNLYKLLSLPFVILLLATSLLTPFLHAEDYTHSFAPSTPKEITLEEKTYPLKDGIQVMIEMLQSGNKERQIEAFKECEWIRKAIKGNEIISEIEELYHHATDDKVVFEAFFALCKIADSGSRPIFRKELNSKEILNKFLAADAIFSLSDVKFEEISDGIDAMLSLTKSDFQSLSANPQVWSAKSTKGFCENLNSFLGTLKSLAIEAGFAPPEQQTVEDLNKLKAKEVLSLYKENADSYFSFYAKHRQDICRRIAARRNIADKDKQNFLEGILASSDPVEKIFSAQVLLNIARDTIYVVLSAPEKSRIFRIPDFRLIEKSVEALESLLQINDDTKPESLKAASMSAHSLALLASKFGISSPKKHYEYFNHADPAAVREFLAWWKKERKNVFDKIILKLESNKQKKSE